MDLEAAFEEAASAARDLTGVDTKVMLQLYGLFKQATVGPCNVSKPGFFDFVGKQKWEAWSSLGQQSKEESMEKYIELVNSLLGENGETNGKKESVMGVSVSCMANTDETINDADKSIFDWVKEGNMAEVKRLVTFNDKLLAAPDDSGMFPIHWASDRGDLQMLRLLTDSGADVNVKDGDGQTALHYSYSCGHEECVRFLLKAGADASIHDAEGRLAEELTYE